jgi:hypothetical protein
MTRKRFRGISAENEIHAKWWLEICQRLGMNVQIAINGVTVLFEGHTSEEINASYELFREEFGRCIRA